MTHIDYFLNGHSKDCMKKKMKILSTARIFFLSKTMIELINNIN